MPASCNPPPPSQVRTLKLTLEVLGVVLLEQRRAVWVRIHRDTIQRVQLTRAVEHVLVDLSVVATERRIELPVGEVPRVDEANGVGTDLLE